MNTAWEAAVFLKYRSVAEWAKVPADWKTTKHIRGVIYAWNTQDDDWGYQRSNVCSGEIQCLVKC